MSLHFIIPSYASHLTGVSPETAPAGATVKISTHVREAAALLIEQDAEACDARREGFFRLYAKNHYRSWYEHMLEQGLDVHLSDIILVTGHHLTGRWATAVLRDSQVETEARVGLLSRIMNGSLGIRYFETRTFDVPLRIGPRAWDSAKPLFAAGSGQILNQCIFLRGYRFAERKILPVKIKAAAGPSDLGGPNPGSASDARVLSTDCASDDSDAENPIALDKVSFVLYRTLLFELTGSSSGWTSLRVSSSK